MNRTLLMLTLLSVACGCGSAEGVAPTVGGDAAWARSTPEAQGLDSRVFVAALRRVRDENIDLHSLIVIRNGHLVLEAYVHPYDRETLHNVKSVSKSVMSAVVGIALERGILDDLDQPVHEMLPEYFTDPRDERMRRITLRHLLTMTAGLDLDENGPKMASVFQSSDWVRATFDRAMVAEPGERFVYSTPVSHVMSVILTRASGKSLLELTNALLFRPLGIDGARWRTDPDGYNIGGADLFLRPLDMARFGQLFMNEGRWEGRQIVTKEWVSESTRDQLTEMQAAYGYWWWPSALGGYMASGWGGQVIRLMPEVGLIAVGTAGDPDAVNEMFRDFGDYEPSHGPLPPNPEAVAEMEALIGALGSPERGPVPNLPPIARGISGARYVLEDNPQGATRLTFEFPGGDEARLTMATTRGDLDVAVGLDGVYRVTGTGSYGMMPGDDNRYGVRGEWVDDHTFAFDSVELGNPNQARSKATFTNDEVEIEIAMRPLGRTLHLRGAKEGTARSR